MLTNNENTLQKCTECDSILSSSSEKRVNICISCISNLATQIQKLKDENKRLSGYVNDTRIVLQAHKEGQKTSENNLFRDENPYNEVTENKQFEAWLSGWYLNEISKDYASLFSIFEWSIFSLQLIYQVSKGYDNDVHLKLETVLNKMNEHLSEHRRKE